MRFDDRDIAECTIGGYCPDAKVVRLTGKRKS